MHHAGLSAERAAIEARGRHIRSLVLFLPLVAWWPVSVARAHELGTLRTTVTFEKSGSWTAEIIVDREHLPPGFGAGGRLPTRYGPIAGLSREAESGAGPALASVANAAHPFFDGRPAAVERVELARSAGPPSEWRLRLSGPIPGGARTFAWSNRAPLGSYLLTLRTEGEAAPQRMWLEGAETSAPFPLRASVVPATRGEVVHRYLTLGFTRMLPGGAEQILFVLCLFLLRRESRAILLQVAIFLTALTIALALTTYGIVALREAILAPLLALSLVTVAAENVFTRRLSPWRIALILGFGLIHGIGLAGVLSELGLPRSEFLPALMAFQGGVVLALLTVVLTAFFLFGRAFRNEPWYRRRVVVPASILTASIGLFWAVQRIAAALV